MNLQRKLIKWENAQSKSLLVRLDTKEERTQMFGFLVKHQFSWGSHTVGDDPELNGLFFNPSVQGMRPATLLLCTKPMTDASKYILSAEGKLETQVITVKDFLRTVKDILARDCT